MNALSPLGMVSETPSSNQSETLGLEAEKDYFVEKDGQKFAGMHLLVDLWGASNLCDPQHIDRALRDEGTSYHYAPPSEYGEADAALVATAVEALNGTEQRVMVGSRYHMVTLVK